MRRGDGRARTILLSAALAAQLAIGGVARGQEPGSPLWAALREGGRVLLMSHPAEDRAGAAGQPCEAERDLSFEARAEARRISDALRRNDVSPLAVLSDASCAGRLTAALAFGGGDAWAPLEPLAPDRFGREQQLASLGERITGWTGPGTLVLVTYPDMIEALTGIVPQPEELLVLRPSPDGTFRTEWRFTIGGAN
jgi:hypothetical protein